MVDVFDAKKESAAVFLRKIPGLQRGVGMAFVKVSGWAGGESSYDGCRHYGMFEQKVYVRNLQTTRIIEHESSVLFFSFNLVGSKT